MTKAEIFRCIDFERSSAALKTSVYAVLFLICHLFIHPQFEENKAIEDPNAVADLLKSSKKDLECLRRQSIISQMYTEGSYFIEQAGAKKL